jgi:hypothetical protein
VNAETSAPPTSVPALSPYRTPSPPSEARDSTSHPSDAQFTKDSKIIPPSPSGFALIPCCRRTSLGAEDQHHTWTDRDKTWGTLDSDLHNGLSIVQITEHILARLKPVEGEHVGLSPQLQLPHPFDHLLPQVLCRRFLVPFPEAQPGRTTTQ